MVHDAKIVHRASVVMSIVPIMDVTFGGLGTCPSVEYALNAYFIVTRTENIGHILEMW